MKDKIRAAQNLPTYLEIIEQPVSRIIDLVQSNRWFFDNPRLGSDALEAAANKLKKLIEEAKRSK